jgi:hypothetical protein
MPWLLSVNGANTVSVVSRSPFAEIVIWSRPRTLSSFAGCPAAPLGVPAAQVARQWPRAATAAGAGALFGSSSTGAGAARHVEGVNGLVLPALVLFLHPEYRLAVGESGADLDRIQLFARERENVARKDSMRQSHRASALRPEEASPMLFPALWRVSGKNLPAATTARRGGCRHDGMGWRYRRRCRTARGDPGGGIADKPEGSQCPYRGRGFAFSKEVVRWWWSQRTNPSRRAYDPESLAACRSPINPVVTKSAIGSPCSRASGQLSEQF